MQNRISQGFTGAIASAVAGEVTRLAAHPDFYQSEGVAYKAAWDRLADAAGKLTGAPAYARHVDAFKLDCLAAARVARFGVEGARLLAEMEIHGFSQARGEL